MLNILLGTKHQSAAGQHCMLVSKCSRTALYAWFKVQQGSNVCLVQSAAGQHCMIGSKCSRAALYAWVKVQQGSIVCLVQSAAGQHCMLGSKCSRQHCMLGSKCSSCRLSELHHVYCNLALVYTEVFMILLNHRTWVLIRYFN